MDLILSIDQSTVGTKGLVWDSTGALLARADVPHRQITNGRGWVEHDPMEICGNVIEVARLAIEKAGAVPEDIKVIGIANQRETAVCWDKKTGLPLYNAIVWQCARAVDITAELERAGMAAEVRKTTGLELSPYFSAAKFSWMVRNVAEVAAAKADGRLCCGTMDSWLVYKLGGSFKTDYSNASRTQLLNLDTLAWDEKVADAFAVPLAALPEICHSDSLFGQTDFEGLFSKPVPIHGVLGDSHAALFANRCWTPFTAKATYGTGSSVMMNVGSARPRPGKGVVTSLAWGIGGQISYVLEGNINYTGAVVKWLVEDIGLIPDSRSAGKIAQEVEDTGGVYLVPAFAGLGAPYFNNDARAAIVGMNRCTKKAHLVRAAEECIAFQISDVVEAMNACAGRPVSSLCADGGPTRDGFLMQFQADILGIPLSINETEELSGKGVVCCAAIGAGVAPKSELFSFEKQLYVNPNMSAADRSARLEGWKDAINTINRRR